MTKASKIKFTKDECFIEDEVTHEVILKGKRINNIFIISLDDPSLKVKCIMANNDDSWLWNKIISHIHMEHLNKLIKHDLVIVLPKRNLSKIDFVMLVKMGNKQNQLSNLIMWCLLQGHYNCYTWISLVHQEQKASEEK